MMAVATIAVAAPHHGPETVVFDKVAAKQPAVSFPHAQHQGVVKSCDTCHHTNKGLTVGSADVKACTSCHTEPQGALGTVKDMSTTKNPLHVSCVGCHKEQAKGPTKCNECHVK
jgi:hypothetical protein